MGNLGAWRVVTHDRYSFAVSGVWPVIPNRVVLRATVIPESEAVGFPIDAALKAWG